MDSEWEFKTNHEDWCPWWCHQMETCSALLALCEGTLSITGGILSQRLVTSFGMFLHMHLNNWWSKQSRRRWFETPSRWLWLHCNAFLLDLIMMLGCITATKIRLIGRLFIQYFWDRSWDSVSIGIFGTTDKYISRMNNRIGTPVLSHECVKHNWENLSAHFRKIPPLPVPGGDEDADWQDVTKSLTQWRYNGRDDVSNH